MLTNSLGFVSIALSNPISELQTGGVHQSSSVLSALQSLDEIRNFKFLMLEISLSKMALAMSSVF